MKCLAYYDRKDYDPSQPKLIRESARAIIIRDRKIVLLYNTKYEIYVFPGGKIEDGETGVDALIRETMEEAGLCVKRESVQEFGTITEIRKDMFEEGIFEQRDFYYFCEVEDGAFSQVLDELEREAGYRVSLVSFDEAIETNELEVKLGRKFTERETYVLKLLMEM